MGQEQSALGHSDSRSSRARPANVLQAENTPRQPLANRSTRRVTDETYDAAELENDLDDGDIGIPGIVQVVSATSRSNHVLLDRLNGLPRFEPFMKTPNQPLIYLSGIFKSDTVPNKEYASELAEPLGIILTRFEEHFHRCSREICSQQTKLIQKVKTADVLSVQATTALTMNQRNCKQAIRTIASVLPTVVQIVDRTHGLVHDIFQTLRELDQLLLPEDRICANNKYPKLQEVYKETAHRKRNTLKFPSKETRDQSLTSVVVTRETARVDTRRSSSGLSDREPMVASLSSSSGAPMSSGSSTTATGGATEILRHIAANQTKPVLRTQEDVNVKQPWGRFSPSMLASSIRTFAQTSDAASSNTQRVSHTANRSKVDLDRRKSVLSSSSKGRDPRPPYSAPQVSNKVHHMSTTYGVQERDVHQEPDLDSLTDHTSGLRHRKSEPSISYSKPADDAKSSTPNTSKVSTTDNSSLLPTILQLNSQNQGYRREKILKNPSSTRSAPSSATLNSTRISPNQQSVTEPDSESMGYGYTE